MIPTVWIKGNIGVAQSQGRQVAVSKYGSPGILTVPASTANAKPGDVVFYGSPASPDKGWPALYVVSVLSGRWLAPVQGACLEWRLSSALWGEKFLRFTAEIPRVL